MILGCRTFPKRALRTVFQHSTHEEFLSGLESIEDASNRWHSEAAILYKMSRAHRMQKDIAAKVDKLEKGLLATDVNTLSEWRRKELLERHILTDL
jgi:hypothetical protein